MPPTFVNNADTAPASTTTWAVNVPSGTQADDILIAALGYVSAVTITGVPSGWTLVRTQTQGATKNSVYWKRATSSEPSTYTWTFNGNATGHACMSAFRQMLATGDVVDTSAGANNGSSTSHVAPSVTASSVDTLLICVFCRNSATVSFSTPTGMVERSDQGLQGVELALDSQVVGSGATGTRTSTSTGGHNEAPCISALFKPSVAFNRGLGANVGASLPTTGATVFGSGDI